MYQYPQQFHNAPQMGGFASMGTQQFNTGTQQFNTGFNQGSYNTQPMQNYIIPFEKPPRLYVKLENTERGYYSNLWSQVDYEDNGKVTGKEIVPFFQRSGLPKEVLREIWLIASNDNETLDRDEFYVALRLIAYAQNKIDVSRESIIANTKAPLPKFAPEKKAQAPETMPMSQNAEQNQQQQVPQQQYQQPMQFQQQPMMQFQAQPQGQLVPLETALEMPGGGNDGPSHFPNNTVMVFNRGYEYNAKPTPQQILANSFIIPTAYDITLEILAKYESYFEKVDPNNVGLFSNAQAKDLFARSNLPGDVLFRIWQTSDPQDTGFLDKAEFIVAVHLLALAKSGVEIPSTLPIPLYNFIREYKKLLPPKQELLARYQASIAQSQQQQHPQQSQPRAHHGVQQEVTTTQPAISNDYMSTAVTHQKATPDLLSMENEDNFPVNQVPTQMNYSPIKTAFGNEAYDTNTQVNPTAFGQIAPQNNVSNVGTMTQPNEQDGVVFESIIDTYQQIIKSIRDEEANYKEKASALDSKHEALIRQIQEVHAQIQKEQLVNQTLRNLFQQKLTDYEEMTDKLKNCVRDSLPAKTLNDASSGHPLPKNDLFGVPLSMNIPKGQGSASKIADHSKENYGPNTFQNVQGRLSSGKKMVNGWGDFSTRN